MIIEKTGNIFTTKCQTIVNTINCVGVMGAGIAFEFRLRDKKMYKKYKDLCEQKHINIGKLWIYKTDDAYASYEKILNFPTKKDWKFPSKEEYLYQGLEKFVQTYEEKGITSIAFPLLGADKGGLSPTKSLEIMKKYLSSIDIDVEIWKFDPNAKDDLYERFKSLFLQLDIDEIKTASGIRIDKVKLVKKSLENSNINSLSGLLRINGVGEVTLEKLFEFTKNYNQEKTLFDFSD